ncbi:MAG: hypothetical protein NVSMB39_5860 [Candidatus Saccharimonadales bacterium]
MKRFIVGIFIFVSIIAVLAIGVFFGVGYYLSPQDNLSKVDAIVAISGGETEARTAEAVRLYKAGLSNHLIFSGAALDPSSPSNARTMAAAAVKSGVSESAISMDELAQDTRGNATGVAAILNQHNFRSIILVTSPYHQRRADINFRHVLGKDFVIINHSSYDDSWRRSHWWATSVSRALTFSELQKVAFELASGQPQ